MSRTGTLQRGEPIFRPLVNKLRRQLADGDVQPGEMLGTELHLARRARISRNSVRAAIDELIGEGLVERRPGKGVFVRKSASTRAIELVLPSLRGIWLDVAHGAQAMGRACGVKVQIFNAHSDFETDMDAVRGLGRSGVDGAIIGSWHQPRLSSVVIQLAQAGFPIVFVDQRLEGIDVPSVRPDDREIGILAGRELLRRGHRRIGYIGHLQTASGRDRLEGLREAVNDAGFPLDRSLATDVSLASLESGLDSEELEQSVRSLVDRPDRPTALVLHRGEHAGAVYPLLRSLGLRIPDDVSVVGVATPDMAASVHPSLAATDLRAADIGRVAMEMLIARLNDGQLPVEHRVIAPRWIDGDSIAERSSV